MHDNKKTVETFKQMKSWKETPYTLHFENLKTKLNHERNLKTNLNIERKRCFYDFFFHFLELLFTLKKRSL